MVTKPCPFCAGTVDPEGWLRNDGVRGPECNDCGATAPNMDVWENRCVVDAPSGDTGVYFAMRHGGYFRSGACGYTGNIAEAGHFTKEQATKFLRAEGVTIHPASELAINLHDVLGRLGTERRSVQKALDSIVRVRTRILNGGDMYRWMTDEGILLTPGLPGLEVYEEIETAILGPEKTQTTVLFYVDISLDELLRRYRL